MIALTIGQPKKKTKLKDTQRVIFLAAGNIGLGMFRHFKILMCDRFKTPREGVKTRILNPSLLKSVPCG